MEKERSEIHARQASLRTDGAALAQEEALVWHELNELLYCDETFRDLRDVARAQIARSEQQNAAVQQTSVLTDLFVISHSGPFATINGFRVGQLAATPVEWNEINAGLGEAALLLQTLANSIGLEFAECVCVFLRILVGCCGSLIGNELLLASAHVVLLLCCLQLQDRAAWELLEDRALYKLAHGVRTVRLAFALARAIAHDRVAVLLCNLSRRLRSCV